MESRRVFQLGLLSAIVVTGSVVSHAAQPMPTDRRGRPLYQSGVVGVKLRSDAAPLVAKALPLRFGIPALDAIADELGVLRVEPMFRSRLAKARTDLPDLTRIYRVTVGDDVDVRRAARLLARDPSVEYAEPLPVHYIDETPDDPLFSRQWFLENIDAEAAWDVHKGEDGAEVVVGISDTGVAWRHEDLVDNIYQNLGEDADGDGRVIEQSGGSWVFDPDDVNGVDDDGNGFPDDFVGWNLLNDEGEQDNDPDDPNSHGTHVAGLAAGRTDNGVGIASIGWNVKILAASASNSESEDAIERGLGSVVYLAENGADIINMSWGSATASETQREVIEYAVGLGSLLVSSAGNESLSAPQYPSSLPGVISVAAVGRTDRLATYSNYGLSVDISAPGGAGINGIHSTVPPNGYRDEQGTSMASPVVAGVFALVKSLHPSWSNEELIEQVLGTADSVDDLNTNFIGLMGEGRVNASRALSDQPSTASPELRLAVMDVDIVDDTGDGSVEAGEGAEIFLTLRNYGHLAASNSVTFTLQSESPYVDVVDAVVTVGITPDMSERLSDAFSIQVEDGAPSGQYALTVTAEASGASVSPHSDLDLPSLIVAGGGLLVWEGEEGAATFSGQWLRDELLSREYDVTYISGEFPSGLVGFDGVFLSFGNAGIDFLEPVGPPFAARLDSDWKVDSIKSYLESGGRLYLDGSDTLGYDVYEIADRPDLLPLFGIASGVDGDEEHPLTSLDGQPGALTEGMRFTDTDQDPVAWIDIFTPSSTGTEAFAETDYGVVAIQHEGRYGQRTFCLAYTLSELVDGSTTRDELLDAMIEFFDFESAGRRALHRQSGRRVAPDSMGKARVGATVKRK
jgi:subtilisin family serine protease